MDIDGLTAFIDSQREAWEVPGCAVVAVLDGKIVLNQGFGLRERDDGVPVTTESLFAIGSTTKAFTAAAVGSLVDEGLVDWDTPLREYLPHLRFHDSVATDRLTVSDVLSHRSGLPRHELVWLGHPERSRADLVHRLRHLEPSKDVRQEFQYCNLGYVVAGHLIDVITGTSWDDYVQTHLLKRLGMDHSNVDVEVSQRSSDFAHPYERRQDKIVKVPFRAAGAMGPAGAINSCTTDMARWLLVNLSGGVLDGSTVMSPDTVSRMQSPQMVVPEVRLFPESTSYAYGFGWAIGQYRGPRIVHHNGGIDGFLTECMLLPEDGAGVVVLTNSSSHLMGPPLGYRVLDELLGLEPIDWSTRFRERYDAAIAGAKQAKGARPHVDDAPRLRPVESYAGEYEHPGYGALSIAVEKDTLVPSFGDMDLTLTHRHFDIFDLEWHELGNEPHSFPLTFLTDADGEVSGLSLPLEPSAGPITFTRLPDAQSSDPEVLASLTGSYVMGPIELVIALKGTTLTVGIPGAPSADLEPVRGLRFAAKEDPSQTIEFVLTAGGKVEKVIIQPVGIFEPKPSS
jgi:CubicO group peptidase (beta-lactamase class C family)